jgi:hypothetical protein
MNNIADYLQMMDVSGQAPAMQNISGQQGLYNQNMNAMKALSQQALEQPANNSNMALANALRKKQPNMMGAGVRLPNSNINPYINYDQSGGTNYGAGSVGGTGIE